MKLPLPVRGDGRGKTRCTQQHDKYFLNAMSSTILAVNCGGITGYIECNIIASQTAPSEDVLHGAEKTLTVLWSLPNLDCAARF